MFWLEINNLKHPFSHLTQNRPFTPKNTTQPAPSLRSPRVRGKGAKMRRGVIVGSNISDI
jgi:hypothetical protein